MDQHLPRFTSAEAYNAAYPDCPVPADAYERNALRAYHAAMTGVRDDLVGTGSSLTVEFLPGGAPGPGEPDRTGTVVASNWGRGPILVLAEQVSLRAAWKVVTGRWPARLSEVSAALGTLSLPENR